MKKTKAGTATAPRTPIGCLTRTAAQTPAFSESSNSLAVVREDLQEPELQEEDPSGG